MSIPLEQLYPFIEGTAERLRGDRVELWRFHPHGSKNIKDLQLLRSVEGPWKNICPLIFCNDQEPLDFDRYNCLPVPWSNITEVIQKYKLDIPQFNFQHTRRNIYDKSIVIHSEKNSLNVKKYQDNWFIPVYYWCHAVIARDWFRYAEHVKQNKNSTKTFLIYNRAWSGTREYRLKFADLLIDKHLHVCCQTTVNPIEPELNLHYSQHEFVNPKWKPVNVLENYFASTNAHSDFSAAFELSDYEHTEIEVVLETLFDDTRWHLTEKILRPIACGQPFILVSTAGSLQYLRDYGFETFDQCWSESYDHEQDPIKRMNLITDIMCQIQCWDTDTRTKKLVLAQKIAQRNKQLFFSKNFFQKVLQELDNNLSKALQELEETNTCKIYFDRRKKYYSVPEIRDKWYENTPDWPDKTRQDMMRVVATARKYYQRYLNNIKKN